MARSRLVAPALLAAAIVAAIGGGCASRTGVGPPVPLARATDHSAYRATAHHATAASRETWKVRGEDFDVTLLIPAARGGGESGPDGDAGAVAARPSRAGLWATQLRNVQGVTTAYLDATVKDDPLASHWLARDANRWLGGSASLLAK